MRDRWRDLKEYYYQQSLSGVISLVAARRNRVRDLFRLAGYDLSDADADAGFAIYRADYARSWRLYEDVLPALRALQGHRMAVLTNGGQETQTEKLEATGLGSFFECVFASAELQVAKPEAAVFWRVCEELGVAPSRCVHVGDRLDVDAMGAQSAGLRSVWLNRRKLPAVPPYGFTGETISTLLDLVPVVHRQRS